MAKYSSYPAIYMLSSPTHPNNFNCLYSFFKWHEPSYGNSLLDDFPARHHPHIQSYIPYVNIKNFHLMKKS